MVKDYIVEGLKLAVSKGEPLEKAMASFYNSGYKKEDIEEAAAAVPQFSAFSPAGFQQPIQPGQQRPMPQPNPLVKTPPMNPQRVSDYGKKPKKIMNVMTIILFVLLFLLLGSLVALILFKDQVSSLLGNLFWRALF